LGRCVYHFAHYKNPVASTVVHGTTIEVV
jgi:hypothetical protein